MEFKIGDVVTGRSGAYWLKHYHGRITGFTKDGEAILEMVLDLGTDKDRQWKNYTSWSEDQLKLVEKGQIKNNMKEEKDVMVKEFKVGSKIKIREDLVAGKNYDGCYTNKEMIAFKGKSANITSIIFKDRFEIDIDKNEWSWSPSMIELVENIKVTSREFKVGDKVKLPKTKSIGEPIGSSNVIRRAIKKGQDYLYVRNKQDWVSRFSLNEKNMGNSGDYFLLKDLELYEETPQKQADSVLKIDVLYKGRQTIAEDENGNVGTAWCHSEEMDTFSKSEGARIAICRLTGEDPFPKDTVEEEVTVALAEPKEIEEGFKVGDYVSWKNENDRYDVCKINSIHGTTLWGYWRDGFMEIPKTLKELESRELKTNEQNISIKDVVKVTFQPEEIKYKVGQVLKNKEAAIKAIKDGCRVNTPYGSIYCEKDGKLMYEFKGMKTTSSGYNSNLGYEDNAMNIESVPEIITTTKTLKDFTSEEILEELKSRLQ